MKFDAHQRPFGIRELMCDSPGCDCNSVTLEFVEIRDDGGMGSFRFLVTLDVTTFDEVGVRERTEREAEIKAIGRRIIEESGRSVEAGGGKRTAAPRSERPGGKVGRNDPCPCGSGKKFKFCCGKKKRER